MTFVGVPERYVEVVLEKVGRKKFRGRAVNMRIARADEGLQQKRPYNRDRSAPPVPRAGYKTPYKAREEGAPYKPREGGAPYKPREGGAPYKAREDRPAYKPREERPVTRTPFKRAERPSGPPRRDVGAPVRERYKREERPSEPPRRGASPFYSNFKTTKKKPPR